MRIIAGEFRGRRLRPPGDHRTRPTADRVREAWFSILGERVRGAAVLDLFAGSGALGLEALSRGARRADFVEVGKAALAALRGNVAALDVDERVRIHRVDVFRYLGRVRDDVFDIVFADPPYDGDAARRLVEAFTAKPFARVLGVEHRSADDIGGCDRRTYGDAAITFCYRP